MVMFVWGPSVREAHAFGLSQMIWKLSCSLSGDLHLCVEGAQDYKMLVGAPFEILENAQDYKRPTQKPLFFQWFLVSDLGTIIFGGRQGLQ